MQYYGMTRSSYAAGDYYSYGAGGLGSFLKKAVGVVGGAVKGFATGGITGAIGGAVSAAAGKQKSTAVAKVVNLPPVPFQGPGGGGIPVPRGTPGATPVPGITGVLERTLPGGASGYQGGAAGAPGGFHWNKSYSYAKGLPAGSFLVRNRAMNPANPRALRRGIRREQAFVALARRVLKGSGLKISRSGFGGRRRAVGRRK